MKCKKHTRYEGIHEPRTDCLDCWRMHEVHLEKELKKLNKEIDGFIEELEKGLEEEN